MPQTPLLNPNDPRDLSDEIIAAASSAGLFRVTRRFINSMLGRLVADQVKDLSDAELERSLDPCIAGPQLLTTAKNLRDMGVLQRLVDHMAREDRRVREHRARLTQMREFALLHLEDLRIQLMQDPSVYARYRGQAAAVIDDSINGLMRRVRDERRYANHRYDRQGELAASLICLAMEYPEAYAVLMEHAAGSEPIRTLGGVLGLQAVLGGLSDDHDYLLIRDSDGVDRLYDESNKPPGTGFVPLTCARDLCEVSCSLLTTVAAGANPYPNGPTR